MTNKDEQLVRMLATLGHPTRLKIVQFLAGRPESDVGRITRAVRASQPNTSHHLGLLKLAGLVESVRVGRRKLYSAKSGRLLVVAAALGTLSHRASC